MVAVCKETFENALEDAVGDLAASVRQRMKEWCEARGPTEFRDVELEIASLCRDFADQVVEYILRTIIEDEEFVVAARHAARSGLGKLRNGGGRSVEITLLGGRKVKVRVDYLRPDLRGRRGRPRSVGKRGKGGAGVYPVLGALGVAFGVTPALAAEVACQVADSDSIRAGRAALARRGISLEYKQTLRIVNDFGRRAVQQRDDWLAQARSDEAAASGPLSGLRIVVATDGGRIRERIPLPGRKSSETGHHRFETPWREPKLFTIYAIDASGKVHQKLRPIYDGTMGDADEAFDMVLGYLKALGAKTAKQLIILGDGAKWIWMRCAELVSALGISKNRVVEIIDWYHAVETLETVADSHSSWSNADRKKWVRRAKRALYRGDIDELMLAFDELAVGRRAKKVNSHRKYFKRNAHRMQYSRFEERKLPLGSGAIESAIRMIVNMRLKGTGSFWKIENAQAMLLLRSYLKAGRFDDLVNWSNASAAKWWTKSEALPILADAA